MHRKISDYYYSYTSAPESSDDTGFIGESLNFASKEAYKQLRTNLDFAMVDVEGARAIGITSSMRGDGKSLTSINLSFFLAEDGYNVLLVEGDLRIPTLSKKLGLEAMSGLSTLLTSSDSLKPNSKAKKKDTELITSAFENCKNIKMKERNHTAGAFDIIVAGTVPPNPQELLGSARMKDFIALEKKKYDYIIVDLPPVTAVADALVASKVLDGMLLVVRQENTEKGALSETIRQLKFSGARLLGFVFNALMDDDPIFYRKYQYKYRYSKAGKYRYYNNYYHDYKKPGKEINTEQSQENNTADEETPTVRTIEVKIEEESNK